MRYALLCYGCEDEIAVLNAAEERAMAQRCHEAMLALPASVDGRFSLRLLPTSTSITLRVDPLFRPLDGPYNETREQLLELWLIECDGLDDALLVARRLAEARGIRSAALEIRPIAQFNAAEMQSALTLT